MGQMMVIDDSRTIRKQVKKYLENLGHTVLEGENGRHALEVLGHLEREDQVDLILCDVNMPEMNGLDFCRQIRKSDSLKSIPILMLTTESAPDQIDKGRELGIKGWVIKPVNEEFLQEVLSKVLK